MDSLSKNAGFGKVVFISERILRKISESAFSTESLEYDAICIQSRDSLLTKKGLISKDRTKPWNYPCSTCAKDVVKTLLPSLTLTTKYGEALM